MPPAIVAGGFYPHYRKLKIMVTTLNDYDIAVLVQLVTERNEVVREMLQSALSCPTPTSRLEYAYSTELAENVVLIAKLQSK